MDWADDRAQALQVGAVLLLGIAVIGLSVYQVTVVPQENREVEFNSYLDASADMTDLRNDILASGQRGVQSGTTVETGTTYPARALFVNPPPATGRLDATEPRNLTIEGAVAVDNGGDEQRVVAEVWNGSARNYSTRAIEFDPAYSRLDATPVVVGSGSVYRATDNGAIPLTGQSLVDGDRITLVTVGGDLSTGGLSSTVTVDPVSTATRTVTVEGQGGSDFDVTLRFDSAADAAAWNGSRVAEDYREQPRVTGTTHPAGESYVNVTLDGSQSYELRLARVTVREANEGGVETEPDPEYIFPVSGNESDAVNGSATTLTAEVRDRYNNPVSGTSVTFESPNGTFAGSGTGTRTVTTTEEGRAIVAFTPNATGTVNVTASFARPTSFNETRFELDVEDGDGTGGEINPSDDVVLNDSRIVSGNAEVDLENLDAENPKGISEIRFNFYYRDSQGQSGTTLPDSAVVTSEDGQSVTLEKGGGYGDLSVAIGSQEIETLTFDFRDGTDDYDAQAGDFFVVSIIYDDDDSGSYFVAPT